MGNEGSKLFNVSEVAEYLNISVDTVRRLIKNEELNAYKIGHQIRVSEKQVNSYLKKASVQQ